MEQAKQQVGDQNPPVTMDYLYVQTKSTRPDTEITQSMLPESITTEGATKHSRRNGSSQNKNMSIVLQNKRERKKGAARMAGFMFWTNFVAVVLLLIGCNCAGWLIIKTDQTLHYSTYSYDGNTETIKTIYAFQDYGLWQITQCIDPGYAPLCQTMPYRVIDSVYTQRCTKYSDCEKIVIGTIEMTEKSELFMFSGVGLVFSYSDIVRMQTLFVLGYLLALSTLYYWYSFRKGIAEGSDISFNRKMWGFLLLLSILADIFVLIPVFMFTSLYNQMTRAGFQEVKTPFGLAIAGSGGVFMTLVTSYTFMQLICCRIEKDVYICSCLSETETQMPEQDGEYQ